MVARFLTFSVLVAAAAAVVLPVVPVAKVAYAQPEAPAQYEFSYSVHDEQSGDVKQQHESRAGDAVQGSYSLVQPDGVHRIVDYTADNEHGFNAVVRYEGGPAPTAYAHAPVTKIAYATAPVAKVAYAPSAISYAQAPAPISYAHAPAQISYAHAPAPISYAHAPAPISYAQAPASISYAQAPTTFSYAPAPASYASAPIAKIAYATAPVAKVAYAQPLGQVTFSSPAVSYHH